VVSGRHFVQCGPTIRRLMPAIDRQLRQIGDDLERLFCDAQDFESRFRRGIFIFCSPVPAKLTPWAALRIECDLVQEGLIDERIALQRLAVYDLSSLRMIRLASGPDRPALSVAFPRLPVWQSGKSHSIRRSQSQWLAKVAAPSWCVTTFPPTTWPDWRRRKES